MEEGHVQDDGREVSEVLARYGNGAHSRLALAAEHLANMAKSRSTMPDDDTKKTVYTPSRMLEGSAEDATGGRQTKARGRPRAPGADAGAPRRMG